MNLRSQTAVASAATVTTALVLLTVPAIAAPAGVPATAPTPQETTRTHDRRGPHEHDSAAAARIVVRFDPARNETPESIAISRDGDRYVSLASTGEIQRITPDGHRHTLARLPNGRGTVLGIALDREENVYANLASFDPATHGIWAITPDGGARRLAALPADGLPNGLTFDARGDLYAADSFLGVIHQLPRNGDTATTWLADPRLAATLGTGFPGANGLQYLHGHLYTANSDNASLLRIPIRSHGGPGEIETTATGISGDDLALDVYGNAYVTTDPANTLVKITPDGRQAVVLDTTDGLDGPTAAAFGRGRDRFRLSITNAAFAQFDTDGIRRPSLIEADLGTRGAHPPLPSPHPLLAEPWHLT